MATAVQVIGARSRNQWVGVTSLYASDWYPDALTTISEIGELRDNWDGYGSPAMPEQARISAVQLLSQIAVIGAEQPHIAPVPGGGLQFEWDAADRSLEFEVLPTGDIEFLISTDDGRSHEGAIVNRDRHIPQLMTWLRTGYFD